MYVVVIIGVDVVVYAVCSVGSDLTRHRYILKGLVSQKSGRVSVKLVFAVECGLILPKFIWFYVKAT